jgi:hypothetical protein
VRYIQDFQDGIKCLTSVEKEMALEKFWEVPQIHCVRLRESWGS